MSPESFAPANREPRPFCVFSARCLLLFRTRVRTRMVSTPVQAAGIGLVAFSIIFWTLLQQNNVSTTQRGLGTSTDSAAALRELKLLKERVSTISERVRAIETSPAMRLTDVSQQLSALRKPSNLPPSRTVGTPSGEMPKLCDGVSSTSNPATFVGTNFCPVRITIQRTAVML